MLDTFPQKCYPKKAVGRPGDRAAFAVRKVRASQGRVPANGRWRQLQGKCNRKKPPAHAAGKDGKARQELTRAPVTDARCKPHLMQDPNRSDTAARRASKEIATTVWQHAAKIDDRPTTELGLRPHRQHVFRFLQARPMARFFQLQPFSKEC